MELGSIHPDEQSARRAVATLLRAGIEPERVKLIGPRARPYAEPNVEGASAWKLRFRDVSGGLTLGAAVGALACVLLRMLRAPLLEPDPLGAYLWIVGTAMLAGVAAALVIQWRYVDLVAMTHAPRRTRARGWAVIVHARDTEQRALAARALRALSGSTAAA
ncbi:MAG TPA: hypothetical protein VIL20_11445 [Sandaracinaceae bacterium]